MFHLRYGFASYTFNLQTQRKQLPKGPESCHFLWKRKSKSRPFENLFERYGRTHGRTETERRSCPRAPHGAHTAHTSDTQGDQNDIFLLTSRSGALSVTPSLQHMTYLDINSLGLQLRTKACISFWYCSLPGKGKRSLQMLILCFVFFLPRNNVCNIPIVPN